MRTNALAAVSITSSLREGFRDGQNMSLIDLERVCVELTTTVRLLVAAKCASRANVELVVRAIEEALALAVGLQDSVLSEDVVITRDDLLPEQPVLRRTISTAQHAQTVAQEKETAGKRLPTQSPQVMSAPPKLKKDSVGTSVSREATILNVLRKYGPLGIKDVAVHMPECGEKTVQRALAALVLAGSIRKEGEKRWSKYHLL